MSSVTSAFPALPRAPVHRTIALAGAGVLALGGIGALAGAPPAFVGAMLVAPVVGAVHVAALTLPGLLVLQPLLGLTGTPASTALALGAGLRDGTALLLAVLPLVLFFGASLGTARTAMLLSSCAGELVIVVTLVRAWRLLVRDEDRVGVVTCTAWAGLAGLVATLSAGDVLVRLGGAS